MRNTNKLKIFYSSLFVAVAFFAFLPKAFAATTTFSYTGAQQTWVVPAGVSSVTIETWGAAGGNGYGNNGTYTNNGAGLGGYASGALSVTAGQTLYIYVGSAGQNGASGVYAVGGFNGGGNASQSNGNVASYSGGGGGGASDARYGGNALGNRVIVGGGGGGGGSYNNAYAGGGGYASGINGYDGSGAGTGGTGGTQSAGGTGSGTAGSLGLGGVGSNCGGGGGGGYYGGGSGGGSCNSTGAGGGSSYIGGVTSASTINSTRSGAGQVTLTWTVSNSAPTISTPTKTSITSSGATLGGNVTSDGGATITGRGACVGTSANPALGGTCFSTTGTTGVFTVSATGLTQNTLYHYRAYATNSVGTSYTTDDTFTTLQVTPSVTTDAASSVTQTTATLNGTADPNGYASTGWFRYFTSNPGTCSDVGGTRVPSSSGTALGSGSTGVAYNNGITGLTPGTSYWSCAIASNANGTGVGSPVQLTTAVGTPTTVTISTGESNSGSYYVTLNGSANPNNYASYGFFRLYTSDPGSCTDSGETRIPALQDGDISLGSGNTSQGFSYSASGSGEGLAPNTTYYYCAFARNAYGTVGSPSRDTFSTPDGAISACDPPSGGNHTILTSCPFSGAIGGVDAGTGTNNSAVLTIGSARTLTMNPAQLVAWGSISMQSGASINLGSGSSLRRSPLWVIDADGDGIVGSNEQYIGAQPAGGVRRNTVNTAYPYFSKILSATTDTNAPIILDCNDNSAYAYRMVANLVKDADNDGYKTVTAAGAQCVGASAVFNGRTYYNDGSGTN